YFRQCWWCWPRRWSRDTSFFCPATTPRSETARHIPPLRSPTGTSCRTPDISIGLPTCCRCCTCGRCRSKNSSISSGLYSWQRSYAFARTRVPWTERHARVRRGRLDHLAARRREPRRSHAIATGDAVHWPDFLFVVPLALACARVLPPLRVGRRAHFPGRHCL